MRVIAGSARSIPLVCPAGYDTRPTTDKIKETLFNMIHFDLPGCVFVDFYSGSGAIGIEALSRGAEHAYFIDNSKKAAECIKANVSKCKLEDNSTIIVRAAKDAIYEINDKADIIFMDPPYELGENYELMKQLHDSNITKSSTIFIIESALDDDLTNILNLGFYIIKEKRYKTNKHTFFGFVKGEDNA